MRKTKKKLTEIYVQKQIQNYLLAKGWNYKMISRDLREKGVDIIVRDGNNQRQARYLFIECKGRSEAKSAKSIAETNFLYALGQIVTRMSVVAKNAYLYGLGLPKESADKALRRIPYKIASHLSLRLYSVDDFGIVTEYTPKDFKSFQLKQK